VVVASLCNKCSALAVRTNSTIRSIEDLKGMKIGYVPGTMHEILLRECLLSSSISPETDVKLVRVDFFDMGLALARGGIDAFLSGEPFPTLAVTEGYGRILAYPYYDDTIGTINAGMLVKSSFLKDNPGKALMMVRVHARATEYLKKEKEIWLKKASTFGTSMEVLKRAESNMELSWGMDERFVDRARALGRRMFELNLIEREPDYDRLFDQSLVLRVEKELGKEKRLNQGVQ